MFTLQSSLIYLPLTFIQPQLHLVPLISIFNLTANNRLHPESIPSSLLKHRWQQLQPQLFLSMMLQAKFRLDGERQCTAIFRSLQRCSIGLKSGLWLVIHRVVPKPLFCYLGCVCHTHDHAPALVSALVFPCVLCLLVPPVSCWLFFSGVVSDVACLVWLGVLSPCHLFSLGFMCVSCCLSQLCLCSSLKALFWIILHRRSPSL